MMLQLLMVSVIPLGLAAGLAAAITLYLSQGSRVLAMVLTTVQFALLVFVWQQTYQVLVTSWR
jgi:hypothetical protein